LAVACAAFATISAGTGAGAAAPAVHANARTRRACDDVVGARARCSAIEVLDVAATPAAADTHGRIKPDRRQNPTTTTRATTTTTTLPPFTCAAHSGYNACDLRSAYAIGTSGGVGQTVAIVDAYDDPNAEADLKVYRAANGLPVCTTANGCFRKVNQNGGTSYPTGDTGWAEEISLDLDMVSAVCPNCHILLVEASSNSLLNLLLAENRAATLGASAISNSWDAGEFSGETAYDSYFQHGIPITVSSGDSGYGVEWPASSPYVTSVGGTSLVKASNARGWSETAWSGAGSGCSAFEPKPAFQSDTDCKSNRSVADVSAIADPNTGVAVYDTYHVGGWLVFGGTSVAAPIVASVYALAGNGSSASTAAYAYAHAHASGLNDVVSGSNGSCGGSYLCTAGPGYDGPTGLGTPIGTGAF
jgi:subtilase family serine protease